MPLNSSSTFNIQFMLQNGVQGLNISANSAKPQTTAGTKTTSAQITIDTESPYATSVSQSPLPPIPIQRQASNTSTASTESSSITKITTEAEVYATIQKPQINSPAMSTTSSTQTDLDPPSPTNSLDSPEAPPLPPPPPVPAKQTLPPESESDSGKGSEPQDDLRSVQSCSSGGERSDLSLDFMPNGTEASTFEFNDSENTAPVEAPQPCRVGMVVTPGAALMIKMVAPDEGLCDNPKLLELLADITEVCWKEITKQAKHEMVSQCPLGLPLV